MSRKRKIQGSVTFWPSWYTKNFGCSFPDPMKTDVRILVENDVERQRCLKRRFPNLPLGSADPKPDTAIVWPSANRLLPVAYGSPPLQWDSATGVWWHDREACPWAWVKTPEDIRSIKPAPWDQVPEIDGLFRKVEEMQQAFPDCLVEVPSAPWVWKHPNSGEIFKFWSLTTLIDQAPFMVGMERFLTMAVGERDLADALAEKNFEIVMSLENYIRTRCGNPPIEGINCMVGTCGTLHSPRTFKRYSLDYDFMVLDHLGRNLPSNLHSCGPSAHLYDFWSQYPNVVFMQTRALVGQTARLRKNLPNTYLELTIHPPQFDFEFATAEEVRSVVWGLAEEVDYRDVSLRVLVAGTNDEEVIDRNVYAFYAAVNEVNRYLCQQD